MRNEKKPPSQRQLRVGEELRHALSEIFSRGDFRDPVLLKTPITITEVRTSPDLKNAKVYIVPLGGENTEEVLKSLTLCKSYLRRELGKKIKLKSTPALSFFSDDSFSTSKHIESLLADPKVAQDIMKKREEEQQSIESEDCDGS